MAENMRRSFLLAPAMLVLLVGSPYLAGPAEARMPLPSGQQTFSFGAVSAPILDDESSRAEPIGVGSLATGGDTVSIQVGLNRFSGSVDVYFALFAPTISSELFMLTSEGALRPFSETGLVPWKQNTNDSLHESLFGDLPLAALPQGPYYLYLFVTPAGDLGAFYLWMTSFLNPTATDYSGTFFVTLSAQPRWRMETVQNGDRITFSLNGEYVIDGEGSLDGQTMTLTGDFVEVSSRITIVVTFSDDKESFSGTWGMSDGRVEGTITGTRNAPPTYDVNRRGIPQFVSSDVIELSKIGQISRFRSGAGHSYTDDFERCRSMKHYFIPKPEADMLSISIFAPFDGVVIDATDEWSEDLVWKGTMIGIRSDEYPAFNVIIFHLDLVDDFKVGDAVSAGQLLGTPADYERVTIADTAFGVVTPTGYKLVSYFDAMTDSVFQAYQARGMSSRSDAVISEEQRDADPLTCEGEQFLGGGNLQNWVTLN
jgi:hypothetical protein